jgi:nitrate/TMAO reductase-like tetraheme cytochrome c subunit
MSKGKRQMAKVEEQVKWQKLENKAKGKTQKANRKTCSNEPRRDRAFWVCVFGLQSPVSIFEFGLYFCHLPFAICLLNCSSVLIRLMSTTRFRTLLLIGLLVILLALPAGSLYYEYSQGKACARCHEIWQPYTDWHTSAHRNVPCSACHGDVFTLATRFHWNNIRRRAGHLSGTLSERVPLQTRDVFQVNDLCRNCHQEEYADWSASSHSATYAEIFLDKKHNRQQLLIDDCLRCHGMHFQGGIRDLVTPVDTTGPWRLWWPKLTSRPAIPCLTCHQMHREGPTLIRPAVKAANASTTEEISRPSLALFDRRELEHVSVQRLPLPKMRQAARDVKISPDPRQALCYQCHAPLSTFEVGSGDDRTPVGVHEGLSCLACHEKHGQKTRASCANCHPHLSNCGLDVETMDTTFRVKS